MKKHSKSIVLSLILCFILTGFVMAEEVILPDVGCELPIADEEITLDVAIFRNAERTRSFDNTKIIQELQDKTNIDLNFETIPQSSWDEKIGVKLATGSLPDIIWGQLQPAQVLQYGQQGMFIPLEGIIEEHCPNISRIFEERPDIKKALTAPDGHIYSLGNFNENSHKMVHEITYINKTWLDELGLEVPTTTDEYAAALRAFKEKDPNGNGKQDEIPFTFREDGWAMGLNAMVGSFGVVDNPNTHIMIKDNEAIFVPMTEGYKEAIKFFHTLYKDGSLDMESFTQNQNQYIAKLKSDPYKIGSFISFIPDNFAGERCWDHYVKLPALKSKDDTQLYLEYPVVPRPGLFTITKENEYPVETMKMIDYMNSTDEMILTFRNGPEGGVWEMNEKGNWNYITPEEGIGINNYINNYGFGQIAEILLDKSIYDKEIDLPHRYKKRIEWANELSEYFPEETYVETFVDPDIQDEIVSIETSIFDYVQQMKANWILNGGIEERWDKYIERLKAMEVDRLIELRQKLYNNYLQN